MDITVLPTFTWLCLSIVCTFAESSVLKILGVLGLANGLMRGRSLISLKEFEHSIGDVPALHKVPPCFDVFLYHYDYLTSPRVFLEFQFAIDPYFRSFKRDSVLKAVRAPRLGHHLTSSQGRRRR